MITEAVLFDMGNTLVKFDLGSHEEVFHKVLASMGIIRSIDEIRRAFLKAEKEAKDLNLLFSIWQNRMRRILAQMGFTRSKTSQNYRK